MAFALHGWLQEYFFVPVLAVIMENRKLSGAITLVSLLHFASMLAGFDGLWRCPIYEATHVPCPGCYLGRAIASLLRGDWQRAIQLHFFAPFILAGVVLIGLAFCLPEKPRFQLTAAVRRLELYTGFSAAVLYGLVIYWGLRLFWMGFHL